MGVAKKKSLGLNKSQDSVSDTSLCLNKWSSTHDIIRLPIITEMPSFGHLTTKNKVILSEALTHGVRSKGRTVEALLKH